MASMPKSKVFEKQFIVLIAIVIIGTAVFAFNPYLILQGQDTVKQIAETIKNQADNAITQNQKIIANQIQQRILVTNFMLEQRQQQNEIGEIWLKFINAMLLDIEQQQDNMGIKLGFNLTDLVDTNKTHITFGNESIAIINGIPNVTLASTSHGNLTT